MDDSPWYYYFLCRLQQLTHWLSKVPAERTQLHDRKGEIKVGNDADLVIWRPEATWKVDVKDIHFKNKLSPYVGTTFYGAVDRTLVRGHTVFDRTQQDSPFAPTPLGRTLLQ